MNRADNNEPTDTVISHLRPREMWDRICASERQYLLVGNARHTDVGIMEQYAPVLSLLAFDGFRHHAFEWPAKTMQPVVDAFNGSARRDKDAALVQLFSDITNKVDPHVAVNDVAQTRLSRIDAALIYAGHKYGMKITALNPEMPPLEAYMTAEAPATRERFAGARNHQYLHGCFPNTLSEAEQERLNGYINQHLVHNLSLDEERAERFIRLSGTSRAALMLGAAHFRGKSQHGIDDFLPQDDVTYVMMGSSWDVQKLMEGNTPLPLRTPDFALLTDLGMAYATPVARRNGLVP